ncbi:helix-turn-helix domain-containing protein [Acetobacter estunensis]|uniref:helix-turn-helix domain-containing protein n=1 Tax=Acetobacter estunensis TaxID=104097 RepID=UPI001C2DAEE3|nr:helix-turn-helix domain-containing protein [Acetobacter estunensis]MBV1838811.1 Fis family transcriptional regulator [Acetobacter estunensis]
MSNAADERSGDAFSRTSSKEIARSWERCETAYGLDPSCSWTADVLSGAEFRRARTHSSLMLRAAIPEMRHLFGLVQGLGLMVLLADPEAVLLARCIDEVHLPACRRLCLRAGAVWDESVAGTNGVGTALRDRCPIALTQGDHWRFCFSLLESYAVPVFDAQGKVAGALNVATFSQQSTRPLASLMMETVQQSGRRIEEQLFRVCHTGQRILSLGPAEGSSTPLVAINESGEVMGATHAARLFVGWTDEMLDNRVNLLGELETGREMSFRHAEQNVIRTALAAEGGNASAAARRLGISRATLYRKMKNIDL